MNYPTLRAEMARCGITSRMLSEFSGIKLSTLYKKLNGTNYFTFPECAAIKKILHCDIPLEILFGSKQ